MTDEKFFLRNDPIKPSKAGTTFETNRGRQKAFWTGLDLLPGQLDFLEDAAQSENQAAEPGADLAAN